jgi:hypothetical protein
VVCSYFATIGTVGFGVYYGLQTFVKSIEIALVLGLVMKVMLGQMRKRAQLRAGLLALQTQRFTRNSDAVRGIAALHSRQ